MAAEKELSISYLPADKSGKILAVFRGTTAQVKEVWEKLWRTHKLGGKLMRQANLQRGGKPMGRMMAGAVVVVSWDNTMSKTDNKKTIWGELYVPPPKVDPDLVEVPAVVDAVAPDPSPLGSMDNALAYIAKLDRELDEEHTLKSMEEFMKEGTVGGIPVPVPHVVNTEIAEKRTEEAKAILAKEPPPAEQFQ